MNRSGIEDRVMALLRKKALAESRRDIDPSLPLGEQGLGLDSLALVEFITALENDFAIEFPESAWIGRERLSLGKLIDLVADSAKSSGAGMPPVSPVAGAPPTTGGRGFAGKFREKGTTGGICRALARLSRLLVKPLYERDSFYILCLDLEHQPVPNQNALGNVRCGQATDEDLVAAADIWPLKYRKRKLQTFRARAAKGYSCYVAKDAGKVVAIDWMTDAEDDDPFTGLSFRLKPGSCFGLDLNEHPEYYGQGIGLGVLIHCLQQSKEHGHSKQYTIVQTANKKMLLTSIQLLGFKNVGRIKTRRILCRPCSTWQINGVSGSGRSIYL